MISRYLLPCIAFFVVYGVISFFAAIAAANSIVPFWFYTVSALTGIVAVVLAAAATAMICFYFGEQAKPRRDD